jgi:hypothetical protein
MVRFFTTDVKGKSTIAWWHSMVVNELLTNVNGHSIDINNHPINVNGHPMNVNGCPMNVNGCPMNVNGCPTNVKCFGANQPLLILSNKKPELNIYK